MVLDGSNGLNENGSVVGPAVSLSEWKKSDFKRLHWLKQKGYINISISFNLDILLLVYSFALVAVFFLSFDNNLSFMCSFVWRPHTTTFYNL